MTEPKPTYLTDPATILALDYDSKQKLLEDVIIEMLKLKLEFVQVSGKYAELRAALQVLKQVQSALQSSLKAEGMM